MRLITYLILLPAILIGIVTAIANRQAVVLSLDPFDSVDPILAFRVPLYLVIFGAILLGMLIGGLADWLSQGRFRRAARRERREVRKLEKRVETHEAERAAETEGSVETAQLPVKT